MNHHKTGQSICSHSLVILSCSILVHLSCVNYINLVISSTTDQRLRFILFSRFIFGGNLLLQAFLVWQLAFSMLILGKRYSWNRLAGCFLVAAGVVLSVTRFTPLRMSHYYVNVEIIVVIFVLRCGIYSICSLPGTLVLLYHLTSINVPFFSNEIFKHNLSQLCPSLIKV